ncbi:MAG: hypothetical protein E4H03_01335 [Myxococcales bacterium]|jgi:protein tyrosine phosphatase (PTP) superfamily phosphohydrolase (DUF442 family)|nr:MAG: hypothetical protein E4H03_01335 [Myxococcales bacterium]
MQISHRRHHPPPVLLALALAALLGALIHAGGEATAQEPKFKKIWLSNMRNAHEFGSMYLGGTVTPSALKNAREKKGVRTVVNLRLPGEQIDWDEGHTCRRYGMEYFNPGFKTPNTLSNRLLGMLRELLADPRKRPILMHDSSGARTGAVWLAYRTLDETIPYDQALNEARGLGLKTGELEDRVNAYITGVQTGAIRDTEGIH